MQVKWYNEMRSHHVKNSSPWNSISVPQKPSWVAICYFCKDTEYKSVLKLQQWLILSFPCFSTIGRKKDRCASSDNSSLLHSQNDVKIAMVKRASRLTLQSLGAVCALLKGPSSHPIHLCPPSPIHCIFQQFLGHISNSTCYLCHSIHTETHFSPAFVLLLIIVYSSIHQWDTHLQNSRH